MWSTPSPYPPTVRCGTCRTSSSHRTSRPIRRWHRRCATRCWSRTCAAMRPASRCSRWSTSSAATELARDAPAWPAGAALALAQPGDDPLRNLLGPLAAHVHADVPGVNGTGAVVAAADTALQGRRSRRRYDVVGQRLEVQYRDADGTE